MQQATQLIILVAIITVVAFFAGYETKVQEKTQYITETVYSETCPKQQTCSRGGPGMYMNTMTGDIQMGIGF